MRRRTTVLVVGVVLFLVVGLLVVGIHEVRVAAARMQCRNNLRLFSQELLTYADSSNDSFPRATIESDKEDFVPDLTSPDRLPPERRLSWLIDIFRMQQLPRLLLERSKAWDDEANVEVRWRYHENGRDDGPLIEQPFGTWKWLQCPANPSVGVAGRPGLTHYVGVAGVGESAAHNPAGDKRNGLFGYDRRTRIKDVTDGTGNTLALIETTDRNGPWTAGGFPTVRGLDDTGIPYLGTGGQFGSNHVGYTSPAVTQAAMMDGSVRSLTKSVAPQLLEALATFAGSEAIPADW